ncbi:autoinducer binding domain-containing protein, partial [Pseudomonas viridiflava]|uniref:autoinducer binding domain-containing protein n=1 Tax=Pseudomonas viridiflava TaxID=33069 RepID=UPI000F08B43C
MCSAMTDNATMGLLIEQMVSTITEIDGQTAIGNALRWLRQECRCERAMFYQFKGVQLLTFVTSNVDDVWGEAYRRQQMISHDPVVRHYRNNLGFLEWDDAIRHYLPPAWYEETLSACNLAPAISYGYTSHCRGVDGVTSIFTLAGLTRNTTQSDKYLTTSLVPVLHRV